MADGSVEIRITGSVDPSVAASANEAKAAMGGLGDSATVSAKAMAAALAAAGGNLKKITPDMVGLGTAAKAAAASHAAVTAATEASTAATVVNTGTINSSRAAYESLALVHEALSGRFTRMVGTSTILAQALAGQAATTSAVAFVTSGLGAAILGTVAAFGAATVAGIQYENTQRQLQAAVLGIAAASGLSASQINEAAAAASNWATQSESETRKAAEAFAAAGVSSEETITQLAGAVGTYAQLTGVKFAEAQKTLAEAMKDPVKGAQELHEQLGILDGDQIEQIQRLTEMGEKQQAVAILTQALTQRTNEANQAGVGAAGTWGEMTNALSNLWGWLGKVDTELENQMIPLLGYVREKAALAADAIQGTIALQAKLNSQSAAGFNIFKTTPEGESASRLDDLKGKLNQLQQALIADTALHGANSDAVKRDRQALEDYTHAVNTYMTPVQKKLAADALDVKIAQARHEKNQQLVKDLTEQKALLEQAGVIESNADAKALAAGTGDVAGAKVRPPKEKGGNDIVSQWEEQLHEAEIASGDFFKDQTEAELAFWESKLGIVKQGSKAWLDVQSKIYDLSKTLAHQKYDQQIADDDAALQADKGNWQKYLADWDKKLADIRAKNTEESTEYKNAHRQMEAEVRQHEDKMITDELSGNNKEIQALKAHLQAMQSLRSEYAKAAEEVIKNQAEGSILGEATAAARIAQIHQQLAQDEIQDAVAAFNKEDALRQDGLAKALARWGTEDERYKNALRDEESATQAFHDKIDQMQAKSTAQQIADIIAIKNAYASYVNGVINSTVTGLTGVLGKTETWRQAVVGIYNSLLSTIDQVLSKMVTKWVVEHVFMTAAQRAQLTIQNAQQAASEATKTAATTAGAATRASVENTGFFAKLLSLLGISVGAHTGTEAAKTAATTAGVTTRTALEATSKAAQSATNVALVTSYAGVAGAAGTASFAAAPWPIDVGAPAFGAAMSSAALAFAAEAALATGTNYLPRDMVVQAHEGERVIPKADNRRLIELVQMGAGATSTAANSNVPAPVNDSGGDVHLHFHGPVIGSRAAMEQWARQNRHIFGAGAKAYARMGGNLDSNRR